MAALRRGHRRSFGAAVLAVAIAGSLGTVRANADGVPVPFINEPGLLCRGAIRQAEIGTQLPPHLMGAIARVESGRPDPVTGRVHPWPWTINAEGQGNFFATKAQAIAFTRQLQARGVQSIDVGCMQINLMFHPDAFQSLEEAFDPGANARYAARFLTQLRDKTGNWETASAWYHSATPEEGGAYREKVVTVMAAEAKRSPSDDRLPTSEFGAFPIPVSAHPGMLGGRGNIIMLPRPVAGAATAQFIPNASGSPVNPMLLTSATSAPGRGLDAYRLRPVRVLSLIAPR